MVEAITDEVRVNIFTQGNQNDIHFAALTGGGYVAVWQSTGQNGSGLGLTGQIYNDFGQRVGLPFFVEQLTANNQTIGDVAGTADGGFVVTWGGAQTADIQARQFDALGTPVGDEFTVNTEVYSTQYQPTIAGLTGGDFVVTWTSYNDETFTYDIRAQRYDAAGVAQGGEFNVNSTTTSTQSEPEVTALGDGGFVVVWLDSSGADGSGTGIYAQRYNAAGVAQGSETLVNTDTNGTQNEPDVVALDGGGYVVVWTDPNGLDGSSNGVFGQIFDASGAAVGGQLQINQTTNSAQFQPSVGATSDGGFFVAWYGYGTPLGTTYDVVGRHFAADGTPLSDDIVVSQDLANNGIDQPNVIGLANGAVIVGWDYPTAAGDGDGTAVYQRMLALDGSGIVLPVSPVLEAVDPSVSFTEEMLQAAPQILDASGAVAVSGPADFDGGRLTLSRITQLDDNVLFNQTLGLLDDVLGLRDQGTGAGEIGVSGTDVTFEGVSIGTITSAGTSGLPLVITFNANADRDAVEAVAENLTYANPSDDPAETVELALLLEDGDGGASEPTIVTVSVTQQDDAPRPVFANDIDVNTYGTSTQQNPGVTALSDGGWVVLWESYGQDTASNNNYGIIGQRYDASGAPVGPEFLVNTLTAGGQTDVDVSAITGGPNDGGFVAVWYNGGDPDGLYVSAQIFDANGEKLGAEFVAPTTVYSTQYQPSVATFADGSFAIAWNAYRLATNSYDIVVQRFDASGATVGGEMVVNSVTASTQQYPEIAALAGGGFAVTWETYDQGGTNSYEIAARTYDANGLPTSGEVMINTATDGTQARPDVVGLDDGRYVVVWADQSGLDGSGQGVYGQIMQADGTPVGSQFLVNENTQGTQNEVSVTALQTGGFAVTYATTTSVYDGSYNVVIQHYDSNGGRVDGEILVNQDLPSNQYQPSIATLNNGDTIIAMRDDSGRDGSGSGIIMQIVGDAANYAGAANNPVVTMAQSVVTFAEEDVNAAPQLLFTGVDVGDADSADFDGGQLSLFRGGVAHGDLQFGAPDGLTQDNLDIRNEGNGAGQIGVSGSSVSFGGTVIGTITSDGANGAALTVAFNPASTSQSIEALLQNITYANPSDDPAAQRDIRVVLTDGDGGTSVPVDLQILVTEDDEGLVALSSEIQVNSHERSTQDQPDVAGLASGGYVTVWESYDQDAGINDYGIFGQRFDASGQPIGSELQINSETTGSQTAAKVAALSAGDGGGYVVTWYDSSNNSGYIKAQIHNDDGSVRLAEFMVETVVFSTQYQPEIAAFDGGFVVTWTSYNGDTSTYDIRGQYFDGAGVPQNSEFTVNTTTISTQDASDVATDGAGNAIVVWQDQSGADGSGYGVFGQRVDSNGALVGAEFQVNTSTLNNQYLPHVDVLSDGRFVVAWYDDSGLDGSSGGVFAQIFAADATPIGTQFRVNEATNSTQQINDVVALSDGGFAISYEDASGADGSGYGAFAQQYNADGSRRDGPLQLNQEFSSTQARSALAEITDGTDMGIAAVWASVNSATAGDGSSNGVFTRVFGEDGTLQPANVVPEVENLDRTVDFATATIVTPQVIDNSISLTDPDSGDFNGGTVELRYTDTFVTATDQLSVAAGKGITVSGSDVLYDGVIIGSIDGSDDGVNGTDLVINLNANATAGNLRYLLEQLAFASTTPAAGHERSVSLRVSDGDGGLSEGDSIDIDMSNFVPATNITLTDVNNATVTETQVEAGVRVDSAVDFDDNAGNGYDGGFVDLEFRTAVTSRSGPQFETLSVANLGTDVNEISLSGSDVSYEGTQIGSIDAVLNGENGSNLRINLIAAATPDAVDALLEALTYTNTSDGPATLVRLELQVTDGNGLATASPDIDLTITPETDGATVALGGEMQVNAFTTSEQINPAITELVDGGFIVTWQSYNQDSYNSFDYGVYQQRYTAQGEPIGPETLVNQTQTGAQDQPDVTGLAGGGWVTVWEGTDSSGVGIVARVFDANGVPGDEFVVNFQQSSTQELPSVAALANGNFVVTWTSQTSAGAGDGSGQGINGRVFDASGTPLAAADLVLNTFVNSAQRDVDVVGLTGGGFVAVWESNLVDGDSYGVAFQRFTDAGVPVGVETVVNTTVAGSQDTPKVAELTDGGFVVTWVGPDPSSDGIFMQRYDANGVAVGGEVQVNDLQSSTQTTADVTGTTDGGWVVTFADPNGLDSSGWAVIAQRYDASGNRIDGNFVVNDEVSSTQNDPVVATLSDGRVVVAWESNTSATAGDGSGTGVFVRLFGTDAQSQSDDPFLGDLSDITLDESVLNAGYTQVFPSGSVAVTDLDSADFDGGRLMVHEVQDNATFDQYLSPDDASQDVMTFAGAAISISGANVLVDGVLIGVLEFDGQSGNGLQVLLNGNATAERVETLLGGLNYRNPSNDPRDTREIEVTISDGDGGVTDHQTFTITITPEDEGLERIGTEVQVNSFTQSNQNLSDVAGLSGGGHVAVWSSIGQDNPGANDWGVFAQRFDVDGQPVGPEFQVNTTFAGTQYQTTVTGLADGTFVVGWEGGGVGDTSGVFGQRFAADGSPIGTEFRFNDDTASFDGNLRLAADPSGGFVAVWQSSTGTDIQARLYDAGGVAVGAEFTVNANVADTQTIPDVTVLSDGSYAFVWYQTTGDAFMRLMASDGTFLTGDTQLEATGAIGTQTEPSVSALTGGGYVVTWTETGALDGSSDGTYAQIFTAAGAAQTSAFLVNSVVSNQQDDARVTGTADGGFVVVYRDTSGADGSGVGVLMQQFDANGNRIDDEVIVNTENSSTQDQPAIDALANGGIVVTWTSNTSGTAGDGSTEGVFSQIFGDPADFQLEGRPALQGLNSTVTYQENALNVGPLLLDANNAVAVSDTDSADFDGGFLRVDNVIATRGYQDQVAPPDDFTQDNIGLRQAQGISISGGAVSVNGDVVGTIVNSGVAGEPFEILLTANATVPLVELLVENLTYRNTSDDPEETRVVRVQIGDGDGGVSDPQLVTITVNADQDGASALFGERQANTETISEQSTSDVATLADGGFVITWRSYNQDNLNDYGVYAQRFDANGNAIGSEFGVNTTVTGHQLNPAVSGLADGGWVITWEDSSGTDGSSTGVFSQRYNDDGTPNGGETLVNTVTSSTQYQSAVTTLENGDYVVTWSSFNNTDGSGYGIYGQVHQEDGTPVGGEFRVNSETASTQDMPHVTALAGGGFAVVWESETSGTAGDGSGTGVFYQVYANSAASYAAVGGELQANTYTESTQDLPSIAGLIGGGHVITWESVGQDGSSNGVFAQQYDAAGVAVGQEFRVNDQRISLQGDPDVVGLSNGGYVIVYTDNNGTDGSGQGVFAQQFAANGNRVDGALQVNTEFSSTQNDPSVSALENGGFVVSWTSATSSTAGDGSGTGVFYQVFTNTAPVVTDIDATTPEDNNLVFSSAAFAAGYADGEDQPLAEIRIDVLPSTGSLEFNSSPVAPGQIITVAELDAGALVYLPPADFNGTADFGWTGSDGSSFAADIALTNITVTPVNDPVGLQAIPDQTISEGSFLNIQALLTDPDNDTYAVTANYGEGDADVTFNTASKTPNLVNLFESEGTYTVNIEVDDQNGSTESTSFTVTVENAAPNADNEFFATDEDTAVTNVNVLIGDSDPGGDPIVITQIDGVAYTPGDMVTLASGATVILDANGDLSYDPSTSASLQALAGGEFDNDSFTYTISDDGGLTDTATVNISIAGADDNVDARDDLFTVTEDASLAGSVFADNGDGADIDPEGDDLSVVSVNGNNALVGAPIVVSGGGILQVNGDGTISFDATGQYDELNVGDTRDIAFTYVVEEDGSNLTASAQGTITITGENDDPTAQDDNRSTGFNTALNFDPRDNDFDVDTGDSYTITDVGTPSNGTVDIELDGTVTYTPDTGFSGSDSFTYEITDLNGGTATATATINVAASNGPDARDDAFATDEDTAVAGDVFADNGSGVDSDPEGDSFAVTAVNGNGASVNNQITLASGALLTLLADGSFDYDPTGAFDGLAGSATAMDSFTYQITEANGDTDTATVSITIDGVNDAPAMADGLMNAAEDGTAVNLNLETLGSDVDSDDTPSTLTYAVTTLPSEGSASITGTQLNFDPGADFQDLSVGETRDVIIGVTATDSNAAGSNEGDVTVTVLGVNDDPTLGAGTMSATEDGAAVTLDLATLGDDIDNEDDGTTLTYVISAAPGEGSASIAGTTLSFDPGAQFQDLSVGETRDVTITVDATDAQGATVSNDVTVTVTGTNDGPVANDDVAFTGFNTAVTIPVLGNDTDVDNGTVLTITNVGSASDGMLTLNLDGTITYVPDTGFGGIDSFTYDIEDGDGGTSSATVTVDVTANNPPVANDDAFTTDEETAINGNLMADNGNGVDEDPDGDAISITGVNGQPALLGTQFALASGALLTVNGDGSFDYDPNGAFESLSVGDTAQDSFAYTLTDANNLTSIGTVVVDVDGVNDAPTLAAETQTLSEDGPAASIDLSILGDDPDSEDDGTTLSYAIVGGTPAEGTTTLLGTQLSFDPGADFQDLAAGESRTVTVDIQATDAQSAVSSIETMSFVVEGANDAPIIVQAGPFNVDENTTAVGQIGATDVDSPNLGYSIIGGADAALFDISATGELTFLTAPDFETPLDTGGNNIYEVQVAVSDGDLSDDALVLVTVDDVPEGPVYNEIFGTDDNDRLTGTDGADYFRSGAGRSDVMTGLGGGDAFDFSDTADNGARETRRITDFDATEDIIIIGGVADVDNVREVRGSTFIYLDGDRDIIILEDVLNFDTDSLL